MNQLSFSILSQTKNYVTPKLLLLLLGTFLLAFSHGYAQQLPGKRPARQPAPKPTAKPQQRPTVNPPKAEPAPMPQADQKDDNPPKKQPTEDENDPEYLRKLEEYNNATLKVNGEDATYYRMDRSSITVLPVIISIPGLGETNEKGKPIYKPSELYKRREVKPLLGDVLVSAKHYYNKVKFDTNTLFTRLLEDSTNFYALTGLNSRELKKAQKKARQQPMVGVTRQAAGLLNNKVKTKRTLGDALADTRFTQEEGALEEQIKDALVAGNVATNILKIWTNKVILMQRILFSQKEADREQQIDTKKLVTWQNLLRKNYVLVLALINPHKQRASRTDSSPTGPEVTGVEGFLYHVDTTRLDIDAITNRHGLRFVGRISTTELQSNAMSEEIAERMKTKSLKDLHDQVKKMVAADLRTLADEFYKEKSYQCAKNYYEYVLSAGPKDTVNIRKRIEFCTAQLTLRKTTTTDSSCIANETGLFTDWVYAQSAANNSVLSCERNVEALQVKAAILKTEPYITAEIGRKEGVYTDQRYLVYQKTLDTKTGKVGLKRVATLRVVKVGNNATRFTSNEPEAPQAPGLFTNTGLSKLAFVSSKRDTTISSKTPKVISAKLQAKQAQQKLADSLMQEDLKTMSIFKQTDGGHIDQLDLIRQYEDYGIGLQVGYGLRLGSPAVVLGADARLGKLVGARMPISGLRIGFNVAVPTNSKKVNQDWKIPTDQTTIIELFLARELYLSPKFDVKPMAGTSYFNKSWHVLVGGAGSLNIVGRNSSTKVRLVPEIGYVLGYTYQANVNLKFDF